MQTVPRLEEFQGAAQEALTNGEKAQRQRADALRNMAKHRASARREENREYLLRLGEDLFDWGVLLRESLPCKELHRCFGTKLGDGPTISVIHHEMVLLPLQSHEDIPGGRLTTELELDLHPESDRLFNYHAWFEGFRTAGGGNLNTPYGLASALYPGALEQIVRIIDRGENVRYVYDNFEKLVKSYKDR